ncbi:hypothetical protein EJ08DRAFT_93596 [Tothia fuscella]|uniref:Uncharacterized protein n=1 Tax=Tothia fuscella TaxID=1048955 RepID=A0A9P4NXV5_9PEZI|nr:hypothetical protein EJ08DRAFT_93596 [Tothia fuscella]
MTCKGFWLCLAQRFYSSAEHGSSSCGLCDHFSRLISKKCLVTDKVSTFSNNPRP